MSKNRNRNKHKEKPAAVTGSRHEVAFPHIEEPRIVFDQIAYHKIMHWVTKCPDEISGLGKVIRQEDGSFLVNEVMLLDQQNTGGSTEIDAQSVAKAMFVLKDTPGSLNFWWHSHVNFDVFWSRTDTDTIQELSQHGWFLASVFNKRFEQKNAFACNVALTDDPKDRLKIFLDDIRHTTRTFLPKETFAEWDTDYDKHVKKKTYYSPPSNRFLPTVHAWDPSDYYSMDKEPTQFDIDAGYIRRFDPEDGWWKEILAPDGHPLKLIKERPAWVTEEAEKEQVATAGKKKDCTSKEIARALSQSYGRDDVNEIYERDEEEEWHGAIMDHLMGRRD